MKIIIFLIVSILKMSPIQCIIQSSWYNLQTIQIKTTSFDTIQTDMETIIIKAGNNFLFYNFNNYTLVKNITYTSNHGTIINFAFYQRKFLYIFTSGNNLLIFNINPGPGQTPQIAYGVFNNLYQNTKITKYQIVVHYTKLGRIQRYRKDDFKSIGNISITKPQYKQSIQVCQLLSGDYVIATWYSHCHLEVFFCFQMSSLMIKIFQNNSCSSTTNNQNFTQKIFDFSYDCNYFIYSLNQEEVKTINLTFKTSYIINNINQSNQIFFLINQVKILVKKILQINCNSSNKMMDYFTSYIKKFNYQYDHFHYNKFYEKFLYQYNNSIYIYEKNCPVEYFFNSTTKLCIQCPLGCIECNSQQNNELTCSNCTPEYILNQSNFNCELINKPNDNNFNQQQYLNENQKQISSFISNFFK